MRRILTNPLALIVIIGVLFLPSVYAWYTIAANMDPYAHTDAITVAVVDEDRGADTSVAGHLNAGEEVVDKLKENHELGWEFVSAEQAKEGVESGRYYAAIVLPESFSSDLVSVFSGHFEQPAIDYYVNEKISAVAPEITDVGARTIEEQINASFVSTVSETVADIAHKLGLSVKSGEITAQDRLSAAVDRAREQFTAADQTLADLDDLIAQTKPQVAQAQTALSDLSARLPGLSDAESDARQTLGQVRDDVNAFGGNLASGLAAAGADATQAADSVQGRLDEVRASMDADKTQLENQLAAAEAQGDAGQAEAERLRLEIAALSAAEQAVIDAGNAIDQNLRSYGESLFQASTALTDEELPALTESIDDASAAVGSLRAATIALGPALDATQAALSQLTLTLDAAQTATVQARAGLANIETSLTDASDGLKELASSASIAELSRYLGIDPTELGQFMAAPVTLKTEVVYPVKNYGSGVAPFFTNLALWVAGFILVALLRLRIDESDDQTGGAESERAASKKRRPKREAPLPPLTVSEAYFGRGLLFLTLGLIQGLIVCCGDLVLGIQCEHPVAFIFAGVVTVFVDLNILYALVFTMRHVGRAIGVIVLIMQIPGSSGEYPVQMMPSFFQFIHPFLPFTYSIDAMREAIGGMYDGHYWIDLACLVPFLICALLFGLIAGRYSFNLNVLFDRELGRTDLLISEEAGAEQEQFRLRAVFQALLASETYRDELLERMRRYRRKYPHLVRGGWIFVAVALLATLILGRLLANDVDGKVIALGIMVATLISVFCYLIIIEFVDDRLAYRLQVSTLETEDLQNLARNHLMASEAGETPSSAPAAEAPPPTTLSNAASKPAAESPDAAESDEEQADGS